MNIDLETMSREELMDLRARIDDAIASAAERERQAAIAAADEAARQFGYSLGDLGVQQAAPARRKTRAGATPKNPPRFRNPANPSQTWSGRGRRPQWIKDAEANGTPLEAMAI